MSYVHQLHGSGQMRTPADEARASGFNKRVVSEPSFFGMWGQENQGFTGAVSLTLIEP